ncbi:MAG: tripartite tricarboxylate transporter substrate binding protein [Pseudomonadota bacterium]
MGRVSIAACLLVLIAGNAFPQSFPAKPLTLICPFGPASATDQYLRAFAPIASKYLGQPVIVENRPGANGTLGPTTMAATARPDGYSLSLLTITAFRVPHMEKVNWDPRKDFTYIIGLAGVTFGVVVKSDSQFRTIFDLIQYAKANPGRLLYGASTYGATAHLAMEDFGIKAGARFLRVPLGGGTAETAKALIDGRIMAISDAAVWGPHVDAGTFRLLVTFGERRSRWNAPTAQELGFDILSYSPLGIVGPKGMDPKVVKLLHDAFNRTLDDPEYDKLLKRLDMVDWYKSSEDYAEWAVDQFRFQRALIERTIGLGRGLQN